MSPPNALLRCQPGIGEWAILHGYRGSIAHGTYEPSTDPNSIDDKDTMALCVPPRPYYIGLETFGSKGTQEIKSGEWDIVVYEIRKALGMLAAGNPNILSLLWLPENLYIKRTDAGRLLIASRGLFATKRLYKSFTGYAAGQLHKMEHQAFEGYMGEKRKALVAKHGYDTKNAAHLIRLLRQGIEFLATGELIVQRQDAAELLQIKHGAWPLEEVKAEANRLFGQSRDALSRSSLPAHPNEAMVSSLCVSLVQSAWSTYRQ